MSPVPSFSQVGSVQTEWDCTCKGAQPRLGREQVLATCYSPLPVPIAFLEFLNVFTLRSSERKGVSSSSLRRIWSIWEGRYWSQAAKIILTERQIQTRAPHCALNRRCAYEVLEAIKSVHSLRHRQISGATLSGGSRERRHPWWHRSTGDAATHLKMSDGREEVFTLGLEHLEWEKSTRKVMAEKEEIYPHSSFRVTYSSTAEPNFC